MIVRALRESDLASFTRPCLRRNFAINANVLRSFLEANSVDYETANSNQALLTTAIADKAKGFTVLVECWK